ncbi:LexA family protein [Tardibacter chloracetimidivorans]|nr:S24 family peptidase [Tardibacter chloracetimidivorans]
MTDLDLIREAMKAKGLTHADLGTALGRSTTVGHQVYHGRRPLRAAERDLLFKWLGITDDNDSGAPPIRRVPIAGKITAGNWSEAVQDPQGWVWCENGGPNTFALRVEGDSMNLVIEEGGYIAIDPDDKALVSGRIYAVMNGDGETTVKCFRTDPARLEPMSTNESHHTIMLGTDQFQVVGRVVWKASPL